MAAPDVAAAATSALLAFFAAMNDWEQETANANAAPPDTEHEHAARTQRAAAAAARCAEVFDRFCTAKPRRNGRPTTLHYSIPPAYAQESVEEVEQATRTKVLVYTRDTSAFDHRYTLVLDGGSWRIDRREVNLERWTADGL